MDLDRVEKQSDRYLMEFKEFLYMGRNNPRH